MSAKSLVPLIPLLVLTTASCAPKPGGQNPGPLVVMIPGRLAKEGSFEDCVYQKMQGGMKLADALAECAKLEPPDLSGTGLDPFDLMDGGTGVRLSDCYGDWNNNAPIEHSANYNEAKHAVQQIAIAKVLRDALVSDWLHETDPQIKKELDDAVDKMSSIASEALAQYESASKTLTADEQAYLQSLHRNDPSPYEPKKPAGTSPPGDWVPPDDNTGVARPATEGQSLCQAVSEFVGECNRDGWRTPECETFIDKMKGCLDRTVSDPADPAEPCGIPPVDPETAREVVLLHCWAVRRPVPGEDPCTDTIKGQAFEYFLRTGARGVGLDPCKNPYVRTTGEDCYPTFTLVKFGESNVRDLIRWGLEKFGGPVFIIPVGPRDPDPEPKPVPTQPDP
jgi:hypothetical protein